MSKKAAPFTTGKKGGKFDRVKPHRNLASAPLRHRGASRGR